jgi:eukaryotic-like serine/threonine-protein kinase
MTRYREVGLLAEGGMAVIAQAERADDGCTVVVKRVRPPFCFDPGFLRLFSDEGAVHAALDHENIVRLLDRGEDDAGPYLVFEHVEGTDLSVVFDACCADEAGRGLEIECVLAFALPLLRALAGAHEATDKAGAPLCVVHRDVSPGNVLIGADGDVKLADFGVATFALKSEATVAGEMKGKFAYMAPEQTRGEKVDPRADLFGAGVVLWECLAGRKLFDGPTDADVVAAVRTQAAPRLDEVRPGLPPALVTLVASLLEKDPDERPASARAVVRSLEEIAVGLGLEEGLKRHAARLARTAPRRELKAGGVDSRRRTQRVLGPEVAGAVVVRPRQASRWPLAGAAALVAIAAVGAGLAAARDPTITTALPDEAPATAAMVTVPEPPTPEPPTPEPPPGRVAPPAPLPASDAPLDPPTAETTATAPTAPPSGRPAPGPVDKGVPRPAKAAAAAPERPAVTGFGQLSITAEPWASVTIDGTLVARETPLRALSLPAGRHVIVLENPVYGLRTLELDVPAGGEIRRFVDLTK